MKQITKDKDFISLYSEDMGIAEAYNFAISDMAKKTGKMIIEIHEKAKNIAPLMDTHVRQRELDLGKSRYNFTEEERETTTSEFMEIYNVANSLLKGKILNENTDYTDFKG